MTSRYRHRRLFNPATAFPTPIEPGEIAVNTANRQIAVGDADLASPGATKLLLAVRIFDAKAQYVTGEFVTQGGQLYRANTNVTPAAFNAAQWDVFGTQAAAKAYVDQQDNIILNGYEAADDALETDIALKVTKTGDTMTGPLIIAALPTLAAHVTNKQYVDEQIAAGGIVTLPALAITYTPGGAVSSTNVQDAIEELDDEKASLYAPAFVGSPTAATPPAADNSNILATTAWVVNAVVNYTGNYVMGALAANAGNATPLPPGVPQAGFSVRWSREDHRHAADPTRAPIDSPNLTGIPTAPAPGPSSNSNQLATTAFVMTKVGAAGAAPLDSPAFTGNPTAPTPAPGDNDTSIATTAFVQAAMAAPTGIGTPFQAFATSQAITVPPGASKAKVTLLGAGGGTNYGGSNAGGAGGMLIKLLTGLTPGLTLSLAIGQGVAQGPGGATTLTSGTQAISALSAGGGALSSGAGGTCSGGDLNITGEYGWTSGPPSGGGATRGGSTPFGAGGLNGQGTVVPPLGFGSGCAGNDANMGGGNQGLAIIEWFP